ncbi:hypothetical protein ACFX2A_038951 [Malus domestica]
MERLTRQNGENVRLKKLFEATKKQLQIATLEASKYREEIDEYRQKGETFVLAVDPSSEEESDDEPSADEQTQQGEDDLEDAEDDGGTQSDIARGSTSGEDDS